MDHLVGDQHIVLAYLGMLSSGHLALPARSARDSGDYLGMGTVLEKTTKGVIVGKSI